MSDERNTHAADDFDKAGQIYSYAFGADGHVIADDEATSWRWFGFALSDARARSAIASFPGLPADARRCLLASGRRVYMKRSGDWLFGTLPDIHHRHYADSEEIGLFHFALNRETLVTSRKKPLQTIDDVRRKIEERQQALATPAFFVDMVITKLLDLLEDKIDDLFEELDAIEDRIIGGRWAGERERLAPLRRRAILVHRHLFRVSGLFRPLTTADIAATAPEIAAAIDNNTAHAAALLHDSEQLQARALLLQEEIMARLSERTNKLLYLLSVLTAVLLPATVIAGFFGMNLHGIPFTGSPMGFWEAAFLAAIGAAAVVLFVHRLGSRD
jgi:zinc transporter